MPIALGAVLLSVAIALLAGHLLSWLGESKLRFPTIFLGAAVVVNAFIIALALFAWAFKYAASLR